MDLVDICIKNGADKAFIIETEKIPFDETLREACAANYCGMYGKNHACPPLVGEPKKLIKKAKSYKWGLVFQTIHKLEDSFDFEGMMESGKIHNEVAKKIYEECKLENCLRLTAGACDICKTCAAETGEPCRFPNKMVSSLEAYCMNVSKLAELCNMKYINGQNTVTYFGVYLFN